MNFMVNSSHNEFFVMCCFVVLIGKLKSEIRFSSEHISLIAKGVK